MMDEIFDIDLEHLRSISDGDEAFEVELVEEYIADAWKLCSHIDEAVSAHHTDEIVVLAHTLKGSSRSVGAEHVGSACERLEHACRSGDFGNLGRLLEDVEIRLRRLSQTYRDELRRAA